jgi:hypothetical protein
VELLLDGASHGKSRPATLAEEAEDLTRGVHCPPPAERTRVCSRPALFPPGSIRKGTAVTDSDMDLVVITEGVVVSRAVQLRLHELLRVGPAQRSTS